MRLALAILFAGTALADPKPDAEPGAKAEAKSATIIDHTKGMSEAQRGVEITPPIDYWNDVTRTPSLGGGTSLGMVQRPRWFNDMRDYSEGGMVIRPPDTGDAMNIMPGTDGLSSGPPYRRFWNLMQYGIDKAIEKFVPSAGGT